MVTTIIDILNDSNNNNNINHDYIINNNNNNNDYKLRKEQFVYGLDGTTSYELLLICSTSFISIIVYYYCVVIIKNTNDSSYNNHRVNNNNNNNNNNTFYKTTILYLYEFVFFFTPMILCQTIWIYPYGILYIIIQLLLSIMIILRTSTSNYTNNNHDHSNISLSTILPNILRNIQYITITIYRSCILILTIISILAIDFYIYPRRYGKTEIYGYSLMDLGAASFIIMAGFITSSAKQQTKQQSRKQSSSSSSSSMTKQMKRMIPLLVMGMLRLITHKGIDYPEHHSEYGIHWNFFFTLSFIIPITSIISHVCNNHIPNYYIPISIFILYQYILSNFGLQDFIVNASRSCPITTSPLNRTIYTLCTIYYSNREGILGCINYTALFLMSEYIAYTYFWNTTSIVSYNTTASTTITNQSIYTIIYQITWKLWSVVIVLFTVWQVLTNIFGFHISRRSTNTIFCIWVLFVNMFQLVSIYTIIIFIYISNISNNAPATNDKTKVIESPPILTAMNRNGLSIFIIANLLTGLINISIDTLSVSNHIAICIVSTYVCTIAFIGILLDHVWSYLTTYQNNAFGNELHNYTTTTQSNESITTKKKNR